jgi:ribokinase
MIVVGSSNTDMVVKSSHLPAPGETVLGADLVVAHGGKGANQAVAAARLGAPVAFVASLGDDAFGREALAHYQREGIDVEFVRLRPGIPSGVALIVVDAGGENQIAVAPGANAHLRPADVEEARPLLDEHRVMLLQLETPLETVLAAARLGCRAGHTVILNPAPAPLHPLPDKLLALVDVLTPNETEAARLSGEATPEAAARRLRASGAGTVVVTLGKTGALLATSEAEMLIPGFQVVAVDATAAGDAFNGGLAAAIERGEPLPDAIRYGHAVAALAVTRLGAQPSLPTAHEVEAFLTEHRDLTAGHRLELYRAE